MTLQEFIKALVMADSLDERTALLEANAHLMEGSDSTSEPSEETLAMQDRLATLETELELQKQKYIDRFFTPAEKEEKEEVEEEEKMPSFSDAIKEVVG